VADHAPAVVWVVDDDRSIRWVLERALEQAGFLTITFERGEAVLERLSVEQPDTIISDIRMPGSDGLALLAAVQTSHPGLPIIMMTAHSVLDSAVNAYQGGAFEYLPKPFDVDDVVATVRRAVAQSQEAGEPLQQGSAMPPVDIIGQAPAMQEVFRAIGRLAHSNISVLINGESGTGKELVARALHRHSPRGAAPMVTLNMAAIPKELIDAELFGHEKGAFTGAEQQRIGRFEQADGGTLFLDEIGDTPPDTQTRLLRVLAGGEFYRVGGRSNIKVNVRIIAATNQDLEALITKGTFREDLYHRLNVIRIHLPRLSERCQDIPLLASHFLRVAANELGGEPKQLAAETQTYFERLPWPGNVRQLENTCRWLTVMAASREVLIEDLPPELRNGPLAMSVASEWQTGLGAWAREQLANGATGLLNDALPTFERVMIDAALERSGGRLRNAAKLLGWGRNTLTRKLRNLKH
jgi:two-component system nitrogen regulation response regulator GlnG